MPLKILFFLSVYSPYTRFSFSFNTHTPTHHLFLCVEIFAFWSLFLGLHFQIPEVKYLKTNHIYLIEQNSAFCNKSQ